MKRPTSKRRSLQTKTSHRMSKRLRSLFLEHLENRVLLAIDLDGVPNWVEQEPGTILNGNNVEGIPGRPQAGAVTAMAPDPTNAFRRLLASRKHRRSILRNLLRGALNSRLIEALIPKWTSITAILNASKRGVASLCKQASNKVTPLRELLLGVGTDRQLVRQTSYRLCVESLEERRVLSTIVWENRGAAGDNFDALFGAGAPAESARAVFDAAINAWSRVVVDFNHGAGVTSPGGFDLELTISMNLGNAGCGASTGTTIGADGKPIQGSQSFGSCGAGGSGWFIDPTPNDNSEFAGAINNAFTGTAQVGSPAAGQSDLYSIVLAELTHNMGICNSGCGTSLYNAGGFTSDTGMVDDTPNLGPGPGNFFIFQGASIDALMTNNNGGAGGSAVTNPLHTAQARTGNSSITFGGVTVFGADDNGNCCGPSAPGSARTLVSNRTEIGRAHV